MALLAIQHRGARAAMQGDAVAVLVGKQLIARKPLHEIDEVHLYGDVGLDPKLRRELLRRAVDVVMLTPRGGYLGRLVGPETGSTERRIAQMRWLLDRDRALGLARTLVAAKVKAQRDFLLRVARSDPERAHPAAIGGLRVLLARASDARDVDTARGIEGQAAALYYRGLAKAIDDPRFRFERRTRRPPLDPVNACLSFGYTLLLRRVESALLRAGLDPGFGALHGPSRGKPALALDVMEPWRIIAVDRLVIRLINRRQLDPEEDFEEPGLSLDTIGSAPAEDGDEPTAPPPGARPCYMAERGRSVLLRAWGGLWRTRVLYPPRDGRFELSAILSMQATEVAQLFEGERETFEPWTPG